MDTFPTPNQELLTDEILIESEAEEEALAPQTTVPPVSSVPKGNAKPKRFRMQGKNFSITFPQCHTKKEVAAAVLKQEWKDEIAGYIVSEENHKDGTPHLHVFLQFKEKKTFCKNDCFNVIAGKQGNYQVTGNIRRWAYIS